MEKYQENLLHKVEFFVDELYKNQLPEGMYFHNFEHTKLVVEGVQVLGKANDLSAYEIFILTLAAFLHDIGYLEKYIGHEEVGVEMASKFLMANNVGDEIIAAVNGCIMATRYPQHPVTKLEQVICDADFYHFSIPDYLEYASRLKQEWAEKLNLCFSDLEWDTLNLKMLSEHQYHSPYGKEKLQEKKELNIQQLIKRIG